MSDRSGRAFPPTTRDSAHRTRISADGVELAVNVSGPASGVPVVVLHGFTGAAQAMEPLTERLVAGLDARIVCPDLVGHGRSEVPDDQDLYRVEAMAGQVAAVADALGCETLHLVGYSMGGRVALTLGCTAPSRLRSLCLIGATAGIADPDERRRRVEADRERAECLVENLESFVDDWMADPLFAGQAALGDAHQQAARAQRLSSNPAGLARSLIAGGTGSMAPLHERLGTCDAPTLVLAGTQDTKFSAIAEQLAAALPKASVAAIEGAGHAAHLEQPDITAAAIAKFISRTETSLATEADPVAALEPVAGPDLRAGAADADRVAAKTDRAADADRAAEGGSVMEADAG